uniref:Protein arginine N-methyltransferase n=1 Tax=Globodera pallida TaxID=36090 RepID=A0A183BW51_GLOPA
MVMDGNKNGGFSPNIGWIVHRDVANEAHTVHWAKFLDKSIVRLCKEYGGIGFTFLIYPIGGLRRFFWKPKNNGDAPPPIHLPDQQMSTELWTKYIACSLSDWIDPDSPEPWLAQLSNDHFCQEVEYARYLGVQKMLIGLKHFSSRRLAELIKQHLHFLVLLPTKASDLGTVEMDVWTIWRDFRTLCGNSARLSVGLSLTADLDSEFDLHNDLALRRWYAEPLSSISLDYSLFICGTDNPLPTLPKAHRELINYLMVNRRQNIVLSSSTVQFDDISRLEQAVHSAKQLILSNGNICKNDGPMAGFFDLLQPLSDNLDSTVYQTFEQDVTKYVHYQRAIKAALRDLTQQAHEDTELVVFVLGAGRGPLVQAAINARQELESEKKHNEQSFLTWKMKLVAVEKNRNAILSLKYCNEERWSNSVQIVQSDMRSLSSLVDSDVLNRPDLIISELLGSFGDNELSPECLDGVSPILKPSTICIPQSYTNFITPIQSLHLHQSIATLNRSKGDEQCISMGRSKNALCHASDCCYVVCMEQFCFLVDTVEPCFSFYHPNKEGNSNARHARVRFTLPPNCELMGFSGNFEVCLYKDINLSTHPMRYTKNMHSWFPALFPLRQLYYFPDAVTVLFDIQRKIDADGCWYEWNIEYEGSDGQLFRSEVQNADGESQYMKLRYEMAYSFAVADASEQLTAQRRDEEQMRRIYDKMSDCVLRLLLTQTETES